jgi:hypothetical protein
MKPRLLAITSALAIALVGCATAADDLGDADAEAGDALTLGAADTAAFTGVFTWSYATRPYWANDIPSVDLTASRYIRTRCYGYDCAKLVPQTGGVQWYRSSDKTYVKFLSFEKVQSGEEWIDHTVVADTYEIKTTSGGIKLRKTYSDRWFYLKRRSLEAECTASGGDWASGACACPALDQSDWSHYIAFFPGLGGCFEIFATSEDGCDSTHGSYSDDDGNAIGTYCLCPVGTYETNAGCAAL